MKDWLEKDLSFIKHLKLCTFSSFEEQRLNELSERLIRLKVFELLIIYNEITDISKTLEHFKNLLNKKEIDYDLYIKIKALLKSLREQNKQLKNPQFDKIEVYY